LENLVLILQDELQFNKIKS